MGAPKSWRTRCKPFPVLQLPPTRRDGYVVKHGAATRHGMETSEQRGMKDTEKGSGGDTNNFSPPKPVKQYGKFHGSILLV
jgi:hypothetical protein